MYLDTIVAIVTTEENNIVTCINKLVPDGPMQPFWGDMKSKSQQYLTQRFFGFLKDRCYEDGRADLSEILRQAGLTSNNPYEWVKVCHGVTFEDFFWLKFEGENVTWNDVKVR